MRARGLAILAAAVLLVVAAGSGRAIAVQPTPSSTLSAGSSLSAASGDKLISDFSRYELAVYATGIEVRKLPESAGGVLWSSAPSVPQVAGAATLTMQTDGNLVLTGPGGLIWSSGTAGTGTHNSVVITSSGNLVMFAGSTVVWSSAANGLYYQTSSYIASSRRGSAVYVNGLVKLYNVKSGLLRDPGRSLYLQRARTDGKNWSAGYEWQNMLTRTTDAHGVVTVGFVQSGTYRYRWFTLATANASTSASAASTR